jgi:hypothetical protein
MTTKIYVPDIKDVRDYMRKTGWSEYPPGPAGSLWSKNGSRVGVPNNGKDADTVLGVIQRIAVAEEQATRSMADRIRYFRFDIGRLRAVNDFKISDSIPLDAAATITSSAKTLLRSSGTTSLRETGEIAGRWAKRGDRVAGAARMAHTEDGSFVVPILVRLPEPEIGAPTGQLDLLDGMGPEIERTAPEPFERRVMRTFAQSIEGLKLLIIDPAEEPSIDTLIAVVELGVSREFCVALGKVLAEDAVSEFETRFQWAPAVQHSNTLPESVRIDSEAVDLVEKTAEKLRNNKIEPQQTFSGTIVALRRPTGDAYGWITVSTIRNGRSCEILVRLDAELYGEAVEWHRDARPVLVEGQIQRSFGRPITVRVPKRCHPVDETFLH